MREADRNQDGVAMPQQSESRSTICRQASQALRQAAPSLSNVRALIGLDGFVDEIIDVVDTRKDLSSYQRIRTIDVLGRKFINAAGQSSNYEMVVKQTKLGGNGPIMANALAKAGLSVSYIGALGYPAIHPVFQTLAQDASVVSIAEPGHTDALEFEDGKIMLGKYATLGDLTWDNLMTRVGLDRLVSLFEQADLIAMTNWTMIPNMSELWEGIGRHVLPRLERRARRFFADLADPEKHTREALRHAMDLLSAMQQHVDVVLGVNLKESDQVAAVMGVAAPADNQAAIRRTAEQIRQAMQISCVVIHPRTGAAAATRQGSAEFAGPFVAEPKISTGAGDHFNAGFCLGQILGLDLEQSLCIGTACSGYYVRTAQSPGAAALADFTADLPRPQ
jgi:sugar/nucleoside kinase (ribokinase family)